MDEEAKITPGGPSLGDESVEVRNDQPPVAGDVSAEVEPTQTDKEPEPTEPIMPKTYHCPGCKQDLPGDRIKKVPLDFIQQKDGSVKSGNTRFTLLCGNCETFLRVYDPGFDKALEKMFPKK